MKTEDKSAPIKSITQCQQWRISGGAWGARTPPSFLDQTEARRAEKKIFFDTGQPPYLRVWMTARPPPSYLKVWIRHRLASFSLLYAVVLPALYKFFYRKWIIRNYSAPISEIFFIFSQKNYNRKCDLWSFLVGVLHSNSQNMGAACCKAPKKGGNLRRNSQSSVLWLLIGSLTREKNIFRYFH